MYARDLFARPPSSLTPPPPFANSKPPPPPIPNSQLPPHRSSTYPSPCRPPISNSPLAQLAPPPSLTPLPPAEVLPAPSRVLQLREQQIRRQQSQS